MATLSGLLGNLSNSSYLFTNNHYSVSFYKDTICKKLIFHKFNFLCKEMFADYYKKDSGFSSSYQKIKRIGIRIKANPNDSNDKSFFLPFLNFLSYKTENYYAKGLYTYPERNLRYTTGNDEFNTEWNKTFKESFQDPVINEDFGSDTPITPMTLETKIYDVEKKYPNELKSINFSTAVKESIKLQKNASPCGDEENYCLYMVLNDGIYELICGGFKHNQVIVNENNIDNIKVLVIPTDAITNTGIHCDKAQCSSCQYCNNGKCNVYKIDLKYCYEYKYEQGVARWEIANYPSNWNENRLKDWYDYLSGSGDYAEPHAVDFYFVKNITNNTEDNENSPFYIKCEEEIEGKKNPYGSLWFNNKGSKIVRSYFAYPNETHTTLNSVLFLPIMFMDSDKIKDVCSNFQITYDYYLPKEIFVSLTKDSEIKTYISFNKSFKDDELLLGSMEIPQNDYVPSFDSTLNINEDCQRGITDIRHDKLINDNHQRIRFDEICNQTNRVFMSNIF